MPYYRSVGDIPRKRHTIHHVDGTMAFEELMGTEGYAELVRHCEAHLRSRSALAIHPADPRT